MFKKLFALFLILVMLFPTASYGAEKKEDGSLSDGEGVTEALEEPIVDESRIARATITRASDFSGGSGSVDDPYQIATAEELALLAYITSWAFYDEFFAEWQNYQGASYVLTNDIALNDTSDYDTWSEYAPKYQWLPVGEWGFSGHFDGDGHTISGMYIYAHEDGETSVGLFNEIGSGATVENVVIKDAFIVSATADNIGLLAGSLWDTDETVVISEISATGHIEFTDNSSSANAGGVVGQAYGYCEILDCNFDGTIKNAENIGGIVGSARCTEIWDCTANGEIIAVLPDITCISCGGIVGDLEPLESVSLIKGCVNNMMVTELEGSEIHAGGIVGKVTLQQWSITRTEGTFMDGDRTSERYIYDGDIEIRACVNNGAIGNRSANYCGGIVGCVGCFNDGTSDLIVSECENNGEIIAAEYAGGIVSDIETGPEGGVTIEYCNNTSKVSCADYVGGIVGYYTPGKVSSYINYCNNSGCVEGTVSAGGMLGAEFLFSLLTSSENMEPLYIQNCRNDGEVCTTDGICGAGGMVGSISALAGEVSKMYLEIENCVNAKDVYAVGCGRVGGILGSTGMLLLKEKTETPVCLIRNCANISNVFIKESGNMDMRDADSALTEKQNPEEAVLTEDEINLGQALLIMGGSAVGGIVGYQQYGIIEDCAFSGTVGYSSNMSGITEISELYDAVLETEDSESEGVVFCGAISGEYYYLSNGKSTPGNTGIHDCYYVEDMTEPYVAVVDTEDGISNVIAMSQKEVDDRVAEIINTLD